MKIRARQRRLIARRMRYVKRLSAARLCRINVICYDGRHIGHARRAHGVSRDNNNKNKIIM